MVSLTSAIRFHALRTPAQPAVYYEDLCISYADLMGRVEQLAAHLVALGIGRGDVVAALMKNSAAFMDLSLAASHLGAVFLPINYRLAADEIAYITSFADARLIAVDKELAQRAPTDLPRLTFDAAAQRDPRSLAGERLAPVTAAIQAEDDLFRLMFTSGTTDRPKAVTHTYNNVFWKSLDHIAALGLSATDRLLVVGPLYHVGAYDLPGIAVLMMGGSLCILRDFDPSASLEAIERFRLTGGWMAPAMLNLILGMETTRTFDLVSFRWLIGGGERTPESRIRDFGGRFTDARYIDSYGLTESCSGDTFMMPGREFEKIGSTGRTVPHVRLMIAGNDGQPLPAGGEGEIWLRGPKVTRGYLRDPEKNRGSFSDGWFRTGDVGYVDEDGFLFLTDRIKDMIISGGENIASSEVERVLYEIPEICEAAVVGMPDPKWGEKPVAVVVLRPDAILDQERLEEFCRDRLAGFKIPRQMIVCDVLPRNPSGKVLKRVLRDFVKRRFTAASEEEVT